MFCPFSATTTACQRKNYDFILYFIHIKYKKSFLFQQLFNQMWLKIEQFALFLRILTVKYLFASTNLIGVFQV